MNLPKPSSSPAQPAATQFDEYFFGEGLITDARNAVAKAIAQTQTQGLPLNGAETIAEQASDKHTQPPGI
jgi:hypothetical protein